MTYITGVKNTINPILNYLINNCNISELLNYLGLFQKLSLG